MPSALADDASMSALSQDPQRKNSDRPVACLQKENVAIHVTDDDEVVPRKKHDKQSLEYLWRSGTAGGIAGCAVSLLFCLLEV